MLNKVSPTIHFHFLAAPFSFKERTALKKFIAEIFKKEGKKLDSINYIFCSEKYLLKLNQQYLSHDTFTDIITFEYSDRGSPVLSDIYISTERVRANAKLFGTSFNTELHRVIFHGALHLCGYKDKKESQRKIMREKENHYLYEYFGA